MLVSLVYDKSFNEVTSTHVETATCLKKIDS